MKEICGALMFFALSWTAGHAQNPWNWQVYPSDPTEIDTVDVVMSFYSDYNLSFESNHIVNDANVVVNVSVFTGMLPISGWFGHRETIGCLDAGSYNCLIYVDYYVWNMEEWIYVGSDSDSGSFYVEGFTFIRADANSNSTISMSDAIYTLKYLYVPGSPEPPCMDASDSNDDGEVAMSDAIYTLKYLYVPGEPPPPPPCCDYPSDCGPDPTPDDLDCGAHPCFGGK